MKFVKAMSLRHPIVRELRDKHGDEAYTYLTGLIELAVDVGWFEVTPKILNGEFRIKTPKINRIIVDLTKAFNASLLFLGIINNVPESSTILNNPEQSSTILNNPEQSSELEGQNPRGSTRDQEKIRLEEKETQCVSDYDENMKLGLEGMKYMVSLNSPNHSSPAWITSWLSYRLKELETQRPDIPKPELMQIWRDSCDKISNTSKGIEYHKGIFNNKIKDWHPSQAQNVVEFKKPEEKGKEAKALLEYPYLKTSYSDEIIASSRFEWREDYPSALYLDNQAIPFGCLQGLKELPAHG